MNEVIAGRGIKVNPLIDLFPPGVVTEISPVDPVAITAVMLVGDTTIKDAAAVPPKLTEVAPVKLAPVMVTVAPWAALAGLKALITGAGIKVKPVTDAVPPAVVTDTLPDDPAATTAVILVAETTANEAAAVPPKLTAVTPVKFVPVIVTVAPEAAVSGAKEEITGGGR